jgi:hypothetical protein
MSKRFEARATSRDIGTICERASFKPAIIPAAPKLRARGKGNWPLETGRLQSLAGCPISWRCDMTSKRVSKSKSSIRREMAKASGLEVHPGRYKVYMEVRKGETCWLWSRSSQHGMQFLPLSPQAGANLHLPQPDNRGIFLPRQSRMGSLGMPRRVGTYLSPYLQAYAATNLAQEES